MGTARLQMWLHRCLTGTGLESCSTSSISSEAHACVQQGLVHSLNIGIHSRVLSALIENSVIQNNTAVSGAGIYTNTATTLSNVQILNNTASNRGGGIYNSASNDILNLYSGTSIDGNTAVRGGGNVYTYNAG